VTAFIEAHFWEILENLTIVILTGAGTLLYGRAVDRKNRRRGGKR
jgi:hypothetical protein